MPCFPSTYEYYRGKVKGRRDSVSVEGLPALLLSSGIETDLCVSQLAVTCSVFHKKRGKSKLAAKLFIV
jgi:hypothetical protein